MKKLILVAVLHLMASVTAAAGVFVLPFDSAFQNGGNILDGNLNPWSDTRTVSGTSGLAITAVSVQLNLAGGYNGDLYAYLSYNGVQVPLLNRVGVGTGDAFGCGDAGLNVTFTSTAARNIHFYQGVSGYSITGGAAWQPDGRTISPLTSRPADFDAVGTASLLTFNGMSAEGDWTLALADVSAGGGQPILVSWGLGITTVPEPSETAVVTAGLTLAAALWRRRRAKQRAAIIA